MRKIVKFIEGKEKKPIARENGSRGKIILPCRGWTPRVGEEWEVELEERDRYFIAYPVRPCISVDEENRDGEFRLVKRCGDVRIEEQMPTSSEEIFEEVGVHFSGLIYAASRVYHTYGERKCSGHRGRDAEFDNILHFLEFIERNSFTDRAKEKALSLIRETIENWERVEKNLMEVAKLFMFDPATLVPHMYTKPVCNEWCARVHLSYVLKEALPSEYSPITEIVAEYLLNGIPSEFPPTQGDVKKALQFYGTMNIMNVEETFKEFYGLELLCEWGDFHVKFESREELEKYLPSLRLFTLKEPVEVDGKWIVWLTELRLY